MHDMLRHRITVKTVILWISVHAPGMAQNRGWGSAHRLDY